MFNDVTCRKCGKRYGYVGEVLDCPPCPSCGTKPDRESLAHDSAIMEEFRQMLRNKKTPTRSTDDDVFDQV